MISLALAALALAADAPPLPERDRPRNPEGTRNPTSPPPPPSPGVEHHVPVGGHVVTVVAPAATPGKTLRRRARMQLRAAPTR